MNHQSSPYAGIARSTIDQASSGTSVTPANAIVGTAVESEQRVRGYAARWATSGRESPVTWRTTACTWLRSRSVARAACRGGVAQPGWDVHRGAELVAEQRQGGVAEREGRVVRDRGGQRGERARPEPEHVQRRPREYAAAASGLVVSAYP